MTPLPPHDTWDALVLGAGVAGLSAAEALCRQGWHPLLLESAPTVGGRCRTLPAPPGGEPLDNGPHLLIGACHHTLALLERLGTRTLVTDPPRVAFTFWTPGEGVHSLACPNLPAPLHLLAGLLGFSPLGWRDRLAALRLGTALAITDTTDPALERRSVTHWLQRLGQTQPLFQRLWGPLCLAALNEPPASASAALFATVLKQAFFQDRQAARLLLPTGSLSQLLADPLAQAVRTNGGRIITRCRVTGLELSPGGITRVHTPRGTLETAGRPVISALPPHALAPLLPPGSAPWGDLSHSPIVSVHLTYPRPAHLPAPLVGLPFGVSQWLFDRDLLARLAPPAARPAPPPPPGARISAVLSGAYRECHWSRERLVAEVTREVAALLPQLAGMAPSAWQVIKEHRATLAPWPGVAPRRPATRTPWPNLLLAGDWTATGLPATIEGAVFSGERAAAAAQAWATVVSAAQTE